MASLNALSDNELIGLVSSDDRAAFDMLYNRHLQPLYQMAWNVLRDRDTSMEVIQIVFVWIWEHRDNLDIRSVPAYLRSAVKYKITDILRSNRVRETLFVNLESLEANHLLFDEDPLELKELKSVIAQISTTLPERARLIFEMSRNEHLSNKEIAAKLNISEKTVENQMTIALRKMRTAMGAMSVWLFFFL